MLMYEMLLGQSPFRGDDEDEIFDAILEDEPLYPITMPRDAVSILQKVRSRNLVSVKFLLTLPSATHSGSNTSIGFRKGRCRGDQKTSIFQGCQLR